MHVFMTCMKGNKHYVASYRLVVRPDHGPSKSYVLWDMFRIVNIS